MEIKLGLKAYRANANKSQEEMAELLKCHVQTYRKIEQTPKIATIEQAEKICKFLQIPFDVKIFT